MALKVHGSLLSPAVLRVVACLKEKEIDYEFVNVNMQTGEHKQPHFLALNPFGQVPAFEDGDLKLFGKPSIHY
nr:glutathione S-transferase [Ipomoea batatas]GMD70991.1 glutathione S-transferase [Ipomoea batatas]